MARVLPAEKLIELEIGFATSDGKTTSSPGGESTVTTDAVLNITSTLAVYPYVTVIDNVTGDSIIEWN